MKKLALKKINLWLAMVIILVVAVSGVVAVSANAFGFFFGGRITYVMPCIMEDPVFEPGICHTCPICTGLLGPGCAAVTQINFIPFGGTSAGFICPVKAFPYFGGYPMPGGLILGSGAGPTLPYQIGVGF